MLASNTDIANGTIGNYGCGFARYWELLTTGQDLAVAREADKEMGEKAESGDFEPDGNLRTTISGNEDSAQTWRVEINRSRESLPKSDAGDSYNGPNQNAS